jgi:transcriptional regulator with XRE-family HTH domain
MRNKILLYNQWHDIEKKEIIMSKRDPQLKGKGSFGERMAQLRTAAGYSQRDLAKEIGISQRMIAYYEKQIQHPPTHLLPALAKALGVTADQLLGSETVRATGKEKDKRLWRRFSQIEKLDAKEKRQVIQLLDTFIEKEQLKQKAQVQ